MKVLLCALTPAYLRHFDPVIRLLADRGHEVHLGINAPTKGRDGNDLDAALVAGSPRITAGRAPVPSDDWHHLALALRACRDYLQFLGPDYNEPYRARAEQRVPQPFRRLADSRLGRIRAVQRALKLALGIAEAAVPTSRSLERYLTELEPDVVLLTPYVGLSTVQPDYLRAARALGIPAAVCVASWDNLSSKSLLRPQPDLVTVWNEIQRREAAELHGLDPDRVAVTGAQCFDHWFGWQARPRELFCRLAGLDPERPYLLYVCFSPFKGAASEPAFVRRWIERLRATGDARVASASVLVRPHPKRGAEWRDVDFSDLEGVSVWPPEGAMVVDERARSDFYDSLFHSAAVVGLNTSAMIEAGIVGRPVHAVLTPEFRESQEETLHFRYLVEVGGGLLRVARDLDEHVRQLGESLAAEGPDPRAERFVREFVRPHGADVPATPVFADAVEELAARPRRAGRLRRAGDPLLRVLMRPPARLAAEARRREVQRRKAAKRGRADAARKDSQIEKVEAGR